MTDTMPLTPLTRTDTLPPPTAAHVSAISRRNCSKKVTVSMTMHLLMYGSVRPMSASISPFLINTPSMLCATRYDVRGNLVLTRPMHAAIRMSI